MGARRNRLRASPLFGLVDARLRELAMVYDERFAATYGPWRRVVPESGHNDRCFFTTDVVFPVIFPK